MWLHTQMSSRSLSLSARSSRWLHLTFLLASSYWFAGLLSFPSYSSSDRLSSSSHSSSLSSQLLPSLLQVQAASQFPGLPLPIDSAFVCCLDHTLLPRDKYVFTKGTAIYIYDAVTQEASYLHETTVHWLAPYGSGILFFNDSDAATFGKFDSATWWSNSRNYWFSGPSYWRWHVPSPTDGASRASVISSGWMTDIDNMDGWLTVDRLWSYIFTNTTVKRYNNAADSADDTQPWPRPITDAFSADFPLHIDDIDIDPYRHVWQMFKGNYTYLYSPKDRQVLPGYPMKIHNDEVDGGVNGMGRTRCSGIMDLSTTIGFIEDKSPLSSLRSMPYASNLSCEWTITVPSRLLQQDIFSGISWRFDRFDLGSGATIKIEELMDKPAASEIVRSDLNWYPSHLFSSAWLAQGSDDAVLPKQNTIPKLLKTYTAAVPPNLNPLIPDMSSSASMKLRVKFTTTSDVGPQGTGFSLKFAMTTPAQRTYTSLDGIFWFSSLGLNGDTQSIVINPTTLTNPRIAFFLRFQMYPLWEVNYDKLVVKAISGLDNSTLQVCSGADLYDSSVASPRCNFFSERGHTPITLVFSAPVGAFASTVTGEYSARTICDSTKDDPLTSVGLSGTIVDGSGDTAFYRPFSNCHWQIAAPPAVKDDVLFITFNFSKLVLFPNAVSYSSDITPVGYEFIITDREDGIVENTPDYYLLTWGIIDFFDSNNVWIRSATVSDGNGVPGFEDHSLPVIIGRGSKMSMYFRAGQSMAEGFAGSYKMHFPPLIPSIQLLNFQTAKSDAIIAQLASIGSRAGAVVWAGEAQVSQIYAVDQLNNAVEWSYPGAFQTIFRLIPIALYDRLSPDEIDVLSYFPRSVLNESFWRTTNYTDFDQDTLDQILEVMDASGTIHFTAPSKAGDYYFQVIFVLRAFTATLSPKQGWGNSSIWEDNTYVVRIREEVLHVAPKVATSVASTCMLQKQYIARSDKAVRDTTSPTDVTTADTIEALKILAPTIYGVPMNVGGDGLNGNFTAGNTLQLIVYTRDRFGNLMEGFAADDIRVFFVSDATSSKLKTDQLAPGIYLFTVTPTKATNYVLTVLVGGNDIFEGPFTPTIQPDVTDASKCTLVVASTGYSVLASALPLNEKVTFVLNAKDKYSNLQSEDVGNTDMASVTWSEHEVKLLSHMGNEWRYEVQTSADFESSVIVATMNGIPVGYDSSNPLTLTYAFGLPVSVGVPVIIYKPLPDAVFLAFTAIAALLMTFALACIWGLYLYRESQIIRAGSPLFLSFMLLGALLEYASIIPMMNPNVDQASCAITPLLGHMGFIAIFGSLFVKTQRVKAIFQTKKLQVISMSDSNLFLRLMALEILFLLYYIFWMITAQPHTIDIDQNLNRYRVCASDSSYASLIPLGLDVILIAYGLWLTSRIWGLPSNFNESKYLLASIYSVSVVGVLIVVLVKFVLPNPHVQLIFTASGILFATTFVICCMLVPKLRGSYLAKVPAKSNLVHPRNLITHVPSHRPPTFMQSAEARGSSAKTPDPQAPVPTPPGSNPTNLTATAIHARIASSVRVVSQIGTGGDAPGAAAPANPLSGPQQEVPDERTILSAPKAAFSP